MSERPTNAPYTPAYFPSLTGEYAKLLAAFLKFCEHVRIPSKNAGLVPLILMATQRYVIEAIFEGLARDKHDFVILKARQLGVSTVLWALDLFWVLRFGGMQGIYIADDEPNKEIHRDIIAEMYKSLPPRLSRGPWRVNNRLQLTWSDRPTWIASRLQWAFANKKNEGQLGRSRGVNYVHGTEMDSWGDREGVAALTASLADDHPRRLYLWEGTGQGYGLLYEMWEQTAGAVSSVQVFIGFWRNPAYEITREQTALWSVYGAPRPTPDELEWGAEVKKRYGVTVTRQKLAWWRWKLAEGKGINGDEAKMMGEYPWLPEQAFQAAGSAFLSPTTCLRVRTSLRRAPRPQHFRYEWGSHFDSAGDDVLVEIPAEAATLSMWEEPQPGMVYVLAADPAYGSGPAADRYAVTVWKCYPDALQQVAEYKTPLGAMYHFAWVLAHLGGLYRVDSDDHLILEIGGPGRAVHEELERMASYGYGLTKHATKVQDVIGQIQHFLYRRVDSMSGQMAWHFNTTSENRIQIFEQLRDTVERGALVVRSADLAEELAALRRDEGSGRIEAGGVAKDDLAFTSALAVHCWLQNVIPEIEDAVAPLTPVRGPSHVGESMLRGFLSSLRDRDEGDAVKRYGMQTKAPGR